MSFSSNLISLNSKTAGKDKIYRTVQYGCKLIWYLLWKNKSGKEYIEILKKIEATMSQTRKVLRFGKSHDMLESAMKSIYTDDYFLRYVITASNINQALYLLLDNTLWLNSIGVVHLKDKQKLLNYSNKFWLFSTFLNLARDFNSIVNVIQNDELLTQTEPYSPVNKYTLDKKSGAYTSYSKQKSTKSIKRFLQRVMKIVSVICLSNRHHPLLLDSLKNVFDLFLPLSNLNMVNLSPGMQALYGFMSSIIGLIVLWDPKLKLKN